jgi:hypothetical protein
MDDFEKIKRLEIRIAEQTAIVHYAGLRWIGFVVVSGVSSLTGMMGGIASVQGLPDKDPLFFAMIMIVGLLGGILAAFKFRRTHKELKELEKERLGMQRELAELRAASYRKR